MSNNELLFTRRASMLEQEAAGILSKLCIFFIKHDMGVWLDQGTLIDVV